MVPDSQRSPDAATFDDQFTAESDGGTPSRFDEAVLYSVVRAAVKDALLDVIGTVLLVGVAFVFVLVGVQALLQSTSLARAAVGVGLTVVGVYIAAATLEVVPPLRDWF